MMKAIAVFFAALVLSIATHARATTFQKGASQFCFSELSAERQRDIYSRIVNLGASFTHGCIECDVDKSFRTYLELTNDSTWIRRNPLVHFLAAAPWKNELDGKFEYIAIYENEPDYDMNLLALDSSQAPMRDYAGMWLFDPSDDFVAVFDRAATDRFRANPSFRADMEKLGPRRKVFTQDFATEQSGILYRTVVGRHGAEGATSKILIDLAIDGGRMHDVFRTHSKPELYKALDESGWRNNALRAQIIENTVRNLRTYRPTVIVAFDLLFWDAVSDAFGYLYSHDPKSKLFRYLRPFIEKRKFAKDMFDGVKRENIRHDLYEVLAQLSRGDARNPAIPTLLSGLMDNPKEAIRNNKLEPVLAALFGQFIYRYTGKDVSVDLADWLRKLGFENSPFSISAAGLFFAHDSAARMDNALFRAPRYGDYFDEESRSHFSSLEITESRELYESFESYAQRLRNGEDQDGQTNFDDMEILKEYRQDASSGPKVGRLNQWVAGLLNGMLLEGMGDLPIFFEGLHRAFNNTNARTREFTSREDNNVHYVSADTFYSNFATFLKPETMHPSVLGAKIMANSFDSEICQRDNN